MVINHALTSTGMILQVVGEYLSSDSREEQYFRMVSSIPAAASAWGNFYQKDVMGDRSVHRSLSAKVTEMMVQNACYCVTVALSTKKNLLPRKYELRRASMCSSLQRGPQCLIDNFEMRRWTPGQSAVDLVEPHQATPPNISHE